MFRITFLGKILVGNICAFFKLTATNFGLREGDFLQVCQNHLLRVQTNNLENKSWRTDSVKNLSEIEATNFRTMGQKLPFEISKQHYTCPEWPSRKTFLRNIEKLINFWPSSDNFPTFSDKFRAVLSNLPCTCSDEHIGKKLLATKYLSSIKIFYKLSATSATKLLISIRVFYKLWAKVSAGWLKLTSTYPEECFGKKNFRDKNFVLTFSQEFLNCGPNLFYRVVELYVSRLTNSKIWKKCKFSHLSDFEIIFKLWEESIL